MSEEKFNTMVLAELVKEEEDRSVFLKLLNEKKISSDEMKKAKEIADLFVQRALAGIDINTPYAQTERDIINKSFLFSGMNKSGVSYLSEETMEQLFDKFIPVALGESGTSPVFNTEMNDTLVSYMYNPELFNYSQEAKSELDRSLTNERKNLLINRASSGRLESSYTPEEIQSLADKYGYASNDAPSNDAPSNDAPSNDAPSDDAPSNDAPSNDAPSNDAPSDDAPSNDAPSNDAPSDDAPSNDAPSNDEPSNDEPSNDAPSDDAPSNDEPSNDAPSDDLEKRAARLGDNVGKPDWAALIQKANDESQKHQLDLDLQLDAQMRLNALMDKMKDYGWANRTVVDKLRDYSLDKLKSTFTRNSLQYPSESIFSDTLSEVDPAGRMTKELVSFSSTPLTPFKASISNPSQSPQVYEAMALRAQMNGVTHPYLKSTFRDPKKAQDFLEGSVAGLLQAGYKLEDIRVQASLEPYFEALKLEMGSFSMEQAPDELIRNPEDEALRLKHADALTLKKLEEIANKLPQEITAEKLLDINSSLLALQKQASDQEKAIGLKDFADEQLHDVLKVAPLLEDEGSKYWNIAIREEDREAGLVPITRPIVEKVESYYSKLLDLADPTVDTRELGRNEKMRLVLAESTLRANNPEMKDRLDFIFSTINPSVDRGVDSPSVSPGDMASEQAPSEQAPSEQAPSEQAPSEQAPSEQAPSEQAPSEQAPSEQAPSEQAPSEQAPSEQAPSEQAPSEQAPSDGITNEGAEIDYSNAEIPTGVAPAPDEMNYDDYPDYDNIEITQSNDLDGVDLTQLSNTKPIGHASDMDDLEAILANSDVINSEDKPTVNSADMIDKTLFQDVLGKSIDELSVGELDSLVYASADHGLLHQIKIASPNENWSIEEIKELENKLITFKAVTNELADNSSSFGYSEDYILSNISDNLIPVGLKDYAAELKSNQPSVEQELSQKPKEEPNPEPNVSMKMRR